MAGICQKYKVTMAFFKHYMPVQLISCDNVGLCCKNNVIFWHSYGTSENVCPDLQNTTVILFLCRFICWQQQIHRILKYVIMHCFWQLYVNYMKISLSNIKGKFSKLLIEYYIISNFEMHNHVPEVRGKGKNNVNCHKPLVICSLMKLTFLNHLVQCF
jgi:hypothetical protein